jgi:hypothetical protein
MVSVSPRPPFQFRLRTLLLLFVVLGSSLAVFGGWGIVVSAFAVGVAIYVRQVRSLRLLKHYLLGLFCLTCLVAEIWPMPYELPAPRIDSWERYFNWPNIAALLVWLLSVGTLLVGAMRGRKARLGPRRPLDRGRFGGGATHGQGTCLS